MGVAAPACWRTPEQLLEMALARSRLVLANEAHYGLRRSVRTRQIGVRLIKAAHDLGVRHLAMEALYPHDIAEQANETRRLPSFDEGYLAQPEMRELIGTALGLHWALVPYEADLRQRPAELERLSIDETNWREDQQAHNLARAVSELSVDSALLVWCGNHHLAKHPVGDWRSMGSRLRELVRLEPFAIDQALSINFDESPPAAGAWVRAFGTTLAEMGGTAGFLAEDAPPDWRRPSHADAYLISTNNDLT